MNGVRQSRGAPIPDPESEAAATAAQAVEEAIRNRSLTDYNRPDQFYVNRSDLLFVL